MPGRNMVTVEELMCQKSSSNNSLEQLTRNIPGA
jgi:hypothetical protein